MEPLSPDDPSAIGPYRLLGRLGRGGMGRVYLGRSAGGRTVAVKVVHPHFAVDERFRSRFAREVAAARLVGGAWTAPVLDADPEAELPWVATGYVAGPDLQRAVGDHGALPETTARALGAGLAEALAAVHASGLVHRDVKPSNVLLALDGPRLIDFGIARASDASAVLTATGVAVGSPGYMAPEQVQGQATGQASDVFSYGAVLAFASGGREPFPGDSAAQLLYRVVHEAPDLERVPAGPLREVVAACLAKEPTERPTPEEAARVCAGGSAAATLLGPGWLPPPVVEAVSRRAVELLDAEVLPTSPATPAPGPATGSAGGAASSASPPPGFGPPNPGHGYANPGVDVPTAGFGPPRSSRPAGNEPAKAGADSPSPGYGYPRPGNGAPSPGYGYPPPVGPPPGGPSTDVPAGLRSGRPSGRTSRRVGVAVGTLVAVAALLGAGGVFLLGDDDAEGGNGGRTTGERTEPTDQTEQPPPDDALPDRYVGEWVGDILIDPGVPGGTMTFTLQAGSVGDQVGTAAATDLMGLTDCVDRLTLSEVNDEEIVFDALVIPEQSDGTGICAQGDFQYVMEPSGEDAIHVTSTHPDSGAEGVLDRQP